MNSQTGSSSNGSARHGLPFPGFFAWIGYLVCTLLVVLLFLRIGGRVALAAWSHFHKPTITDLNPRNPAYVAYPWATDCTKDQLAKERDIYAPFRLWGVPEVHGNCINNDVSELGVFRRTINPRNPSCAHQKAIKIWVFGGSAVYGTMIPDWATLPSSLARALNTTSRCVEVANLGLEGYVSNQELLLLIEELKAGHIPDAVIFYDGFNDADAGTSPSGPATHLRYVTMKQRLESKISVYRDLLQHLAVWRLADRITRGRGRQPLPRVSSDELPTRAAATLNNYLENLKIAEKLGEVYGFKVCAFWQPSLVYGHKPLVPYEQEFLTLGSEPAFLFTPLVPVYQEAERRAAAGTFVFLGDVFDSVGQPIYLDWVHINPEGNQLVANAIAGQLANCLPTKDSRASKAR